MSEIKACPFCGSSNIHGPIRNDYAGDHCCQTWFVSCNNCPGGMDGEDSGDSAIEAWNNRPGEGELIGLLKDIRDDLKLRAELQGNGVSVVNLSNSIWERIKAALAKVEGK